MADPTAPKDAPRAAVPVRRPRAVPMVIPSGRPDEDPPPSVKGAPGAPRPRVVGARSPDETGMLPLQPVGSGGGGGATPSPSDASATTFFALPTAPRAERPRPAPTPAAVSVEAEPAALITGTTVASRPSPAPSAPPADGDSRVVSWRVWALLLAVFALMGMFVLAVVGVWILQNRMTEPTATVTPVTPVTPLAPEPAQVEAPTVDPVVITPVAPVYRPRSNPPASSQAGSAPPAPPPTAAPSTGTVSISFSGELVPAAVEVVCNSTGFRERVGVSGNRVTIQNVPAGAACQGVPKGIPASNFSVKAGGSYACAVVGTTTSCN